MRIQRPALIGVAAVALASCAELTGPLEDHGPLVDHQLQVQVRAAGAPPQQFSGVPSMGRGITSIAIHEAYVVLGGLKLETASVDGTVDWILQESVVIPLAFSGQPTMAFDVAVPAGTYKELEVSVDKLEVGLPDEQALIALHPFLEDASVLVTGEVVRHGATEAFEFAAPLDVDLELLFPEPLALSGGDVLVTLVSVDIDPTQWFVGAGGEALDPSNPADESGIQSAITASIEVLKES